MKLINIFSFFLITLIIGCKKGSDTIPSEIKIGDFNNMTLNVYDTVMVGGYYDPCYYNIDLDKDGIDDIQFESNVTGSPAVGDIPYAKISSLHKDALIHTFYKNDTSFLHISIDTFYYESDPVTIGITDNFTCHRINENDSIIEIAEAVKIKPLKKDDIIKTNDNYTADTITLLAGSFSYPPILVEQNGDTVIYNLSYYSNDCNQFPQDEINYIGIKLGNNSKLGWIKISISDVNKISILESGIQK